MQCGSLWKEALVLSHYHLVNQPARNTDKNTLRFTKPFSFCMEYSSFYTYLKRRHSKSVLPISFLSDGSCNTSPLQVDLSTFLLKNQLCFSVAAKLEGALVGKPPESLHCPYPIQRPHHCIPDHQSPIVFVSGLFYVKPELAECPLVLWTIPERSDLSVRPKNYFSSKNPMPRVR